MAENAKIEKKNIALPAQILAANPNISAQVSANAGTGKTHVLTQRVLRLLLAEVQPSRIVCLTYTRTAAAEMSERISSRLQKWAVISDAELAEDLENLTSEKPSAESMAMARQLFAGVLNSMPPPRIQTIHSFCQEILKKFPLEAGITPYFSVIDDVTSKELIAEAKHRIIHNQKRPELLQAVSYIAANTNETWFNEMLREVTGNRNKFRKYISGDSHLSEYINSDAIHAKLLDYDESLMKILLREWTERSTKTHQKSIDKWEFFQKTKRPDDYLPLFLTQELQPLKSVLNKDGMLANPELEELVHAEQARIMEVLDEWRTAEMLNLTFATQEVAAAFIRIYDELKTAQNVLDYEDLIFHTNNLLAKSNSAAWILYKLDGGIDHILIDEAQDASPEQWEIISQISAEFFVGVSSKDEQRSVFIVGDEKQSIYSFQGARPKILREVAGKYGKACVESGKEWHKIPLSMSFRSLPNVLGFVDNIFNSAAIKQVETFTDEVAHAYHRSEEGAGLVELWPLFEAEKYEDIGSWELPVKSYKSISHEVDLAEEIVKKISGWLKQGRVLKSKNRAVEAGDIVILLRKRGKLANILVRKLKESGIPVAGSDRLKLTEHIAIQDLVALADFCLYPQDDLALASILKSPVLGVSEEELFEIAYSRGNISLYENLTRNIELKQKIDSLLKASSELSIYEFYDFVLNNLNIRSEFLARMGDEVNDPLDEFLDLILQYESSHSLSLQNFIQWFKTSDYEIKRDMEARGKEVRVMTAHAAKGLQAPIIFMPDTTSDVSSSSKAAKIYWDEQGRFFAMSRKANACEALNLLIERDKEAEYEEYLRLFYVALTRAEDELYICGTIGHGKDPKPESWYGLAKEQMREIGVESDGIWRFGDAEFEELGEQKTVQQQQVAAPQFLTQKLPQETRVTDKPKFTGKGFDAINRGIKIHKFFEHYDSSRENIMQDLAEQYLQDDKLVSEVLAVIQKPEFAEIFAQDSLSEASVIYQDENNEAKILRLDRLILTESTATIIDFKTGAKNASGHKAQMNSYAKALKQIYPNKQISAKILWTSELELESVELDIR